MSSNMEVVEKKMIVSTSNNKSEKESTSNINTNKEEEEEDQDVALPGFRFHPTDEELVGFYLRRKVENKPLSIELIKQIDIYKYDPWDLPKVGNVGDKEWYFFCIRGRKYRNSIRPNRVTGSGFWKATGIDKPIYSAAKEPNHDHDGHECNVIGLKKSLVYYRGSAGKGTKTDWMMHEFRLPPPPNPNNISSGSNSPGNNPNNIVQEAEVWTLCRIFKRVQSSYYTKKYNNNMMPPDHQNISLETKTPKKSSSSIISSLSTSTIITPLHIDDSSSKTCSLETDYNNNSNNNTIDPLHLELDSHLNAQLFSPHNKRLKPVNNSDDGHRFVQFARDRDYCDTSSATTITTTPESQFNNLGQWFNNSNSSNDIQLHHHHHHHHQAPIVLPDSSFTSLNLNPNPADQDFFTSGSWDELRSVVQLAVDRSNPSHQLHDKPQ